MRPPFSRVLRGTRRTRALTVGGMIAVLAAGLAVGGHALISHAAGTDYVTDCTSIGGASGTLQDVVDNAGSGDTIAFTCSSGGPTIPTSGTNLSIPSGANLTIDGTGGIVLDGETVHLIMAVASGATVTIEHMTLQHGENLQGGGLDNSGQVTLDDVRFDANVGLDGGAIFNDNTGKLTIDASSVLTNNAGTFGGAIYNWGVLTITGSSAIGVNTEPNTAYIGGGITNNDGSVTVEQGSSVSYNTATSAGAGIYSSGASASVTLKTGAKIEVDYTQATSGDAHGGAIYDDGGTLTIQNSTISDNLAQGSDGSGSNGYAGLGGGLFIDGATATITDSAIEDNNAQGGAGDTNYNGGVAQGGAIFASSGSLLVSNSLFGTNAATGGVAGSGAGTFPGAAWGGAIIMLGDAAGTILNSTFSENTIGPDAGYGAAMENFGPHPLQVGGSVLVNNLLSGAPNECQSVVSLGYNISDDASCSAIGTDQENVATTVLDPTPAAIGTYALHVYPLLTGSPALDAIPYGTTVTDAASVKYDLCPISGGTDEGGTARPQGASCDIGSSEMPGTDTTTTLAASATSAQLGSTVTLTATVDPPTIPNGGSVTFLDGTTVLQTVSLNTTTGKAAYTSTSLGLGAHSFSAVYSGTDGFSPTDYNRSSTTTALSVTITASNGLGGQGKASGAPGDTLNASSGKTASSSTSESSASAAKSGTAASTKGSSNGSTGTNSPLPLSLIELFGLLGLLVILGGTAALVVSRRHATKVQ